MKNKSEKPIVSRIRGFASLIYKKFRALLSALNKLNPRRYQFCYKAALWLIDMLPLLIVVTDTNNVILVVLLVLAFFFGLLLYGATLKNKYDEDVNEAFDMAICDLEKKSKENNELSKFIVALFDMHYQLAEKISIGSSYMNKKGADKQERLLDDLGYLVEKMEYVLSKYYDKEICVCIKLVTRAESVRTFARGKNNIAKRGGEHIVAKLYNEDELISENYAFDMIINKQRSCFIEGDLRNIKTVSQPGDTFKCKRSKWEEFFLATAVFPVRGLSKYQPDSTHHQYDVIGIICIDAHEIMDVWQETSGSMVYTFGAFCANLLYSYLSMYNSK